MGSSIAVAVCLAIVGAILYYARKGGRDDQQNKANTDVLKDLGDLSKPVGAAERDSLQQRYRRD